MHLDRAKLLLVRYCRLLFGNWHLISLYLNIVLFLTFLFFPHKLVLQCWDYRKIQDDSSVDPMYLVKSSLKGMKASKIFSNQRPLHLDGLVHGGRLTNLIIPIHSRQIDRLIQVMKQWALEDFLPCTPYSEEHGSEPLGFYIGLTIYFNCGENVELKEKIINTYNSLPPKTRQCFSNLSIRWANLHPLSDNHLVGSRIMFENIIDGKVGLAGPPGYTLLMEPDCHPVRPFWLSILDSQCRFPNEPFWVKGSVFRGLDHIMVSNNSDIMYHINGNAIYNLGDQSFRYFYFNIMKPWLRKVTAFDVDMHNFLNDKKNYNYVRHVQHLFQYTDTIQNWYHSSWKLEELRHNSPTVVLVHGGPDWTKHEHE